LAQHTSLETHACVLELATGIHRDAAGAAAELASLRGQLAERLSLTGLAAASAGAHPLAPPVLTEVSADARHRAIAASMRALAQRVPTMALHVHVGVPDPEDAVRVLNGLRRAIPLLVALSANSPFCEGRDTDFASIRTTIFGAFPRTGPPRRFHDYADYIGTIGPLISSGALPDPTFLWWDVRLQPKLGTVEVRAMDAQSTVAETAPLIALVQSLARRELEDEPSSDHPSPEVLGENRFLAARDGTAARLIDSSGELVPASALLDGLLASCLPHAVALGCSDELERVRILAAADGADRQRAVVATGGDLRSLLPSLAARFAPTAETLREID
jgi:carboxylate-amine ligase